MKTEIKIPTDAGIKTASGLVAFLMVGSEKHKFVLQDTGYFKTPQLTHFASGLTFGKLEYAILQSVISGRKISVRQAAKIKIAQMIKKVGIDRVLVTLSSAQVIN